MSKTMTLKPGQKRMWAWVPTVIHSKAKASAAMKSMDLQDWVGDAVREKLDREERARRPA